MTEGRGKETGEERESDDQYPGPIPTWIISLPLFRTLFPFEVCVCVFMLSGGGELHEKFFFLFLLSLGSLEITFKL